jgi:hypothetical protein
MLWDCMTVNGVGYQCGIVQSMDIKSYGSVERIVAKDYKILQ